MYQLYQLNSMFVAILMFLPGACVGSFLNVVIYRLPRGGSLLSPPSNCPHCHAPIRFYHNVPLLGWLVLRGRAHCCGGRISCRYPLVELLTALIWALIGYHFARHGLPEGTQALLMLAWAVFASALIAISFIDIDLQIIPDELSKGGTLAALALSAALPGLHPDFLRHFPAVPAPVAGLLGALCGAMAGAGVILLLTLAGTVLMRKQLRKIQEEDPEVDSAIGLGDVKLMAFIGAFVGWKFALLAMLLGCFYGAFGGIIQKLASGSSSGLPPQAGYVQRLAARWRSGASLMPFGPYLCAGGLTTLFFGAQILDWLLGLYIIRS